MPSTMAIDAGCAGMHPSFALCALLQHAVNGAKCRPPSPSYSLPARSCPMPSDQAQQFLVNVGRMWPAVLACTQRLAKSLPSLGGEDEAGPDGVAATLRQLPTLDPSQYPEYEPPMMAAKQRLIQRRRAEDAVAEAQVTRRTPDAFPASCFVVIDFFSGGFGPLRKHQEAAK